MPAGHCGAALVECIIRAESYNGQVTSPFLCLAKAGVIDFQREEKGNLTSDDNTTQEKIENVKVSLKLSTFAL